MDDLDVAAHMEPAPPPQAGEAEASAAAHDSTAAGRRGAADAGMTPLGAESLAAPAVPQLTDPEDASLLALIDRLSSLLDRTDLTELEVQVGETGLILRKPQAIAPPTVLAAAAPVAVAGAAPAAAAPAATDGAVAPAPTEAAAPARPSVKAPLTGIWYSAPAPGSAPFVSAGGEVNTGQVIGLIEAMKLFNEIKSDLAGRVVKVHAEDGKLVKAKQPLIEVEPL
jgi:acetyl-CoA carboxylase biotin carboxyl carrier protein